MNLDPKKVLKFKIAIAAYLDYNKFPIQRLADAVVGPRGPTYAVQQYWDKALKAWFKYEWLRQLYNQLDWYFDGGGTVKTPGFDPKDHLAQVSERLAWLTGRSPGQHPVLEEFAQNMERVALSEYRTWVISKLKTHLDFSE